MPMRRLRAWFAEYPRVLVALSGGVDSALVTYAAHTAPGIHVAAVTADYKTLASDELESARNVASQIGVTHHIIEYNELDDESFVRNDSYRCYHCRTNLGSRLVSMAKSMRYDVIVDGTHADDVGQWRPGIQALREYGIRSPLLEVGMTKADVRMAAQEANLHVHDRPSNACLASRVPWGKRITAQMLTRIEMAERYVRHTVPSGPLRVRHVEGKARIEVDRAQIPLLQASIDDVVQELEQLGFAGVEVDPGGYRSGGANA